VVDVALSIGRVLLAVVLVLLNGFFVAAEFALVRVRGTSVESLVEEGRPGATALSGILDDLDDYLAVTQLGITIASLGLGWAGEPAIAALLEPVLASVLPAGAIHLVAFAVGFGIITFLHVVFGELAPKTIAIQRTERVALLVAAPMRLCYYLFVPGIIVFNGAANRVTALLGVSPASETDETLTEAELRRTLARSDRAGHVDADEAAMIERVFALDDVIARDSMTPRPDLVSVPADATLPELRRIAAESGHTRYPVLDGEDPVGFLDVKDVLRAGELGTGAGSGAGDGPATAADLARDLPLVPETARMDDVLAGMRADRSGMAGVIDEWGAFEGILTVEDAVEVVVGDIRDEFDADEPAPSIESTDGGHLVDGGVPVREFVDAFGLGGIDTAGFGTVGGLVIDRLGRAPRTGDSVTIGDRTVEVRSVDGTRVDRVRVTGGDEGGDGNGNANGNGNGSADGDSGPADPSDPDGG